jgi:hypothetical protein
MNDSDHMAKRKTEAMPAALKQKTRHPHPSQRGRPCNPDRYNRSSSVTTLRADSIRGDKY